MESKGGNNNCVSHVAHLFVCGSVGGNICHSIRGSVSGSV